MFDVRDCHRPADVCDVYPSYRHPRDLFVGKVPKELLESTVYPMLQSRAASAEHHEAMRSTLRRYRRTSVVRTGCCLSRTLTSADQPEDKPEVRLILLRGRNGSLETSSQATVNLKLLCFLCRCESLLNSAALIQASLLSWIALSVKIGDLTDDP